MTTQHGAHCFDGTMLVCGWPDFHTRKCSTEGCQRAVVDPWLVCDDCAQKLIDRVFGIAAPEPQPELPRWSPAA